MLSRSLTVLILSLVLPVLKALLVRKVRKASPVLKGRSARLA